MALVLDTRFLLTYLFPPISEDRDLLIRFARTRLRHDALVIPAIVVTEFLKIAGRKIGISNAEAWIRCFIESSARIEAVMEKDCFEAGRILCRHHNVPIADALIAAIAKRLRAIVITDDPHFKEIGVKTLWYR